MKTVPNDPTQGDWQIRAGHAASVIDDYRVFIDQSSDGQAEAEQWLAGLDPRSHVGSRHHYVPRFLLERWATSGQVQTFSRIENEFATRNINDLAMKDFYTFIDQDLQKNSSMESLLGEIEKPAARVLRGLLNPFTRPHRVTPDELAELATFAAFQLVRTPRHRREVELHAEWLVKTYAQGQVPDVGLREITVTPHQNDAIRLMAAAAQDFTPLLACRPLALVVLDRPRLLIGDDPVLINAGPDDGTHTADCFMTDAEFEARLARERSKKKGRRRKLVSRVIHFSSTVPRGLGVAHEVVFPISPRAVLLWGPLRQTPYAGDVERIRLDAAESDRFAALVNDATCAQALDWVVARNDDAQFAGRVFPPVGPLMRVCDGENAASLSMNQTPQRLRPARLW